VVCLEQLVNCFILYFCIVLTFSCSAIAGINLIVLHKIMNKLKLSSLIILLGGILIASQAFLLIFPVQATHKEVNGCGDDSGLGQFVPNQPTGVDFRPVCDDHDRCYGTLRQSREHCDNKFRGALRARCEKELLRSSRGIFSTVVTGGSALGSCYSVAEIYYQAVRERGGEAYSKAQNHAREENAGQDNKYFFSPPWVEEKLAQYPMFEPQYYLKQNPDVNEACKGNLECSRQHYLKNGLKECRVASPYFNPRWYLENNPDVKNLFVDCRGASEHWSGAGRQEGRAGASGVPAP
jgi:hypothetical protein